MTRVFFPALALYVLLCASAAFAAIPKGEHVLAMLAEVHPKPTPFIANYVEQAPEGGLSLFALRVVSDGQGRARLDVSSLRTNTTESRFFATTEADGVEALSAAPVWLQWWLGEPIARLMALGGVKTESVSLAHIEGTVTWVLGAGPREPARPQVHVERSSGRLRGISGGDEVPIMAPARLDDYIAHEGTMTRFPRRLTLRLKGRDVVFVNTWLRRGAEVVFEAGEFTPAPR